MQQSYGSKSNMPESRPVAELLVALNEFNRYELYTGTGDGVQPLFGEGAGTPNVSFDIMQTDAAEISGKFVYFDYDDNTWKLAYAQAQPSDNKHYTAQGFAIQSNNSVLQVTTGGKLTIPFALTDVTGAVVEAGKYYYLCQDKAFAGEIQLDMPTSGIKQVVCQILSISENETIMLLLNNLNQTATDIIQINGDGSKYLGDDGQYHPMQIAGLTGRTTNCINEYELLDIDYDNVEAGRTIEAEYSYPSQTANNVWKNDLQYDSFAIGYYLNTAPSTYIPQEVNSNYLTRSADWGPSSSYLNLDLKWQCSKPIFLTSIYQKNNTVAAQVANNWQYAKVAYSDNGETWTDTGVQITNPSNAASAEFTHKFTVEQYKSWGQHMYWKLYELQSFAGSSGVLSFNTVRINGFTFDIKDTNSKGYIATDGLTISNEIASNFSINDYIISKYQVSGNSSFGFNVKQKFNQVAELEPIWSAPNVSNNLSILNGILQLTLDNVVYKGIKTYEAGKFYYFRTYYNQQQGYVISVSEDGVSWTPEIILYDELSYLNNATIYLGFINISNTFRFTSGSIDLSSSGFTDMNEEPIVFNYPLSAVTDKNVAKIVLSFKGLGLTAAGRAKDTNTVLANEHRVETTRNTILATDAPDLVWDTTSGLSTVNYQEVGYKYQYTDSEDNTVLYANDMNKCYKYTTIYPNFLTVNTLIQDDSREVLDNLNFVGSPTLKGQWLSGFSSVNFAKSNKKIDFASAKKWKIVEKIKTGSDISTVQCLLSGRQLYGPTLYMKQTSDKCVYLSSNKTAWNIVEGGVVSYAWSANTDYWVSFEFTGSKYVVSVSTDGEYYTQIYSLDSTAKVSSDWLQLGISDVIASPFLGSIDLSQTYVELDGVIAWSASRPNPSYKQTMVDFSKEGAEFHPNRFLDRTGFDFNLKLDFNRDLKIYRNLDARNYGSTNAFPFYYAVQGCTWSDFLSDENYVQGIKQSNPFDYYTTGTALGTLYQTTVLDDNYSNTGGSDADIVGMNYTYFKFQRPIRFSSIGFRNYSNVNYLPQQYCIDVSNDLTEWHSIVQPTAAGYTKDTMINYMPATPFANWPNATGSALFAIDVEMPDDTTYWKYVRIGLFRSNYRPLICGIWVGMYYCNTDFSLATSTATELIFEKKNFIGTESSGINAKLVRAELSTSYQVQFLDKIGYVGVSPKDENNITDIDGKVLLPNKTMVYKDVALTEPYEEQLLAYQCNAKQFLRNDRIQSIRVAGNPYNNTGSLLQYSGCATTGTVANSYWTLQYSNDYYDFANGTDWTEYIISFVERCFVGSFYFQNYPGVDYDPQELEIYGAVDGGYVANTASTSTSGAQLSEPHWERIPIENFHHVLYGKDSNVTEPRERPSTYRTNGWNTMHANGNMAVGEYGAFIVKICPKRSYQQFRVRMKRSTNRILMSGIIPQEVYLDPYATRRDENGVNLPLLLDYVPIYDSVFPVLGDSHGISYMRNASAFSTANAYKMMVPANADYWDPEDSRRYVYLQQQYSYPVNLSLLQVSQNSDLAYAAQHFELYGTNVDELGTMQPTTQENGTQKYTRINSLKIDSDRPTMLNTSVKESYLSLPKKEYGYRYFTALLRRNLNNRVIMDGLCPKPISYSNYNDSLDVYKQLCTYTQEFGWTNVEGKAGDFRRGGCYDHPLLETRVATRLTPSYKLMTRKRYNPDAGFTVVGSSTITDDGVASGFSSGNYVKITQSLKLNNSWEITQKIKLENTATSTNVFLNSVSPSTQLEVFILKNNDLACSLYVDGKYIATSSSGKARLTVGLDYICKLQFTGDSYIFSYSENGIDFTKVWEIPSTVKVNIDTFNIGYSFAIGSIDLKQFSITVDGKEVLSGAYPNEFYTPTDGIKGESIHEGTPVYRTSGLVDRPTLPYENRWMYKFTNHLGEIRYSNTAPTAGYATLGSKMWKNIIPEYNKEYYTGIPLDATANTGSVNGYTYSASSEYSAAYAAWVAFQNPTLHPYTWLTPNGTYSTTTGLPTGDAHWLKFQAPKPLIIQGYSIGKFANTNNAPIRWKFEGSNDGEDWTLLDKRIDLQASNNYINYGTLPANTGGVVDVSCSNGSADIYKLFNGTVLTFNDWSSTWIQIDYKKQVYLNRYYFAATNTSPAYYPTGFDLLASNDGEDWTLLDSQNYIVLTQNQAVEFCIKSQEQPYRYYRIAFKQGFEDTSGNGSIRHIWFNAIDASVYEQLVLTDGYKPCVAPGLNSGSEYFFENETPYTQYRWTIEQVRLGTESRCSLKVWSMFVLEDEPADISPTFELKYTDSDGVENTAYDTVNGTAGTYVSNGYTLYKDVLLTEPFDVTWAYQVSDGKEVCYTKVAGNSTEFVPETTVLYKDFDFKEVYGEAKLDTWEYTGTINKKYAYTGTQVNVFKWDGLEPYNKYFYTGETYNQFKYTGKIEGWSYTGLSETLYDIVPTLQLDINRDDVRTITRKENIGTAYPVANITNLSVTTYWTKTTSDVAGSTVPLGTALYASPDDDEPVATADGTTTYVYSSNDSVTSYKYSHVYCTDNNIANGTYLTGSETVYYDTSLTNQVDNSEVDLSKYYYDSERTASTMHSFYHSLAEQMPQGNYTLGLNFDGSKYTFTCYGEGSVADIQEYNSGELTKVTYSGQDTNAKRLTPIIMHQQDLVQLNLDKSTYSWWEWNKLLQEVIDEHEIQMFRLAKIDGSSTHIDEIQKKFPWKIGDGDGNVVLYTDKVKQVGKIVVVDSLNKTDETLPKSLTNDSVVLFNTPIMPCVPYDNSKSGTSYAFTKGGLVIATTPCTVTLFANQPSPITFTNFVGILPVNAGTSVTTSAVCYFGEFY